MGQLRILSFNPHEAMGVIAAYCLREFKRLRRRLNSSDCKNWTGRQANDFLGNRAKCKTPPSRFTKRCNDDKVDLLLLGNAHNYTGSIAMSEKCSTAHTFPFQLTDNIIQTLLCILME